MSSKRNLINNPSETSRPLIQRLSLRTYLLFEVLIALSLISVLLSILFSFMTEHLLLEKKMEKARFSILERQNLQTRLQDLFTSLNRIGAQSSLYTQLFPKESQESLVLTFDNGVDPDPMFSGTVIGRLYLDEKNNLCLALWAASKELSWRNEILLSGVAKFSFQFLGEKKEANLKILPISPSTGWHQSWSKERGDLPSLIRLNIHQKETSLQFAFRLPVAEPIATYWQKGFKS